MVPVRSNDAESSLRSVRRFGISGTAAIVGKILQIATAAFVGFSLPLCLAVSDVGVFFFAQAVVTVGAIVAQLGFNHTIPLVVGRSLAERDAGRARSTVRQAILLCLIAGVLVSSVLGAAIYLGTDRSTLFTPEMRHIAPILIPMILMTALLGLMAELQRAVFSLVAASFLPIVQNVGVCIFVALALVTALRPSVGQLLFVSLVALAAASVWGAFETWRTVSRWQLAPIAGLRTPELLMITWPNLVAALSYVAASQLDIWVVSLNGKSIDVAHYGIALRIAALLAIPLTVVSLTILPHIVTNWTLKRRRYLQWLLSLTATASTFVVAIGLLIFWLCGSGAIRLIFGDGYLAAYTPALILGIGQLLFTAGGVAGYILIVLGKQRLAMVTLLAIGAATVLVAIPVMYAFGITGVAVVYAASSAIQALTNAILVRRHFGLRTNAVAINPFRIGKILRTRPQTAKPKTYSETVTE